MTGMITTFFVSRKYGFITDADGVRRFFHLTNCVDPSTIVLGAKVEFEIGPPNKLGMDPQCMKVAAASTASTTQEGCNERN